MLSLPLRRWTSRALLFGLVAGLGQLATCSSDVTSSTHHLNGSLETRVALLSGLRYKEALDRYEVKSETFSEIDPKETGYWEEVSSAFSLRPDEQEILKTRGFVLLEDATGRNTGNPGAGESAADLYYRVFNKDLPVFVTTDSILHAWHRSFDTLLETLERERFRALILSMLSKTMATSRGEDQASRDALTFLAVAQLLLTTDDAETEDLPFLRRQDSSATQPSAGAGTPEAVREPVLAFIEHIKSGTVHEVNWMGREVRIDFGLFRPRGRYANDLESRRYFRALTWLGHMSFSLLDESGTAIAREQNAARRLVQAIHESGSMDAIQTFDNAMKVLVGPANSLGVRDLEALCKGSQMPHCVGDNPFDQELLEVSTIPAYSGHWEGAVPGNLSFRLLPKRFAWDAWVTAQTTTPKLNQEPLGRGMASELDVAFVLGSNRALVHLAPEMAKPKRKELPARLVALRELLQDEPPRSTADSVYNRWLENLGRLSTESSSTHLPQVMRTESWADHRLETMLASWAELRHDTVLYVEQSLGGFGCSYPLGYVDPQPEFFDGMAEMPSELVKLLKGTTVEQRVRSYAAFWTSTMRRLASMARKELAGTPLDKEDLAFLNDTVDKQFAYVGTRSYDGWYPKLHWENNWTDQRAPKLSLEAANGMRVKVGDSEPLVADVHTNGDSGEVLQVGVGHPELLIVAVETPAGHHLYAGPAYGFYSFHGRSDRRMTDGEWRNLLLSSKKPKRPDWAEGLRGSKQPEAVPKREWP